MGRLVRPMLTLTLLLVLVADALPQLAITYTASGTFTPPAGVTSVIVECWGGGGRGGSRTSSGGGGGGGGGAYSRSTVTVVPSTSYTVTVGTGSTSALAGGDSWFGVTTTILAKGGSSSANNSSTGGAGGLASAGVGSTKYNGGDGFTTTTNGGGGGSSAGSAAVGANATGSTGATAPADGGDGGDGPTSGNNAGGAASDPGGGGGGARRSSGGSSAGGAGGDGRVVVTYSYTAGNCLTASPTIPDDGCGTSTTYSVTLPQTGLPTALGSSPGNARFVTVELIIAHAFNRDVDVTLTSPSGATRNLMLDRFGTGVNIGNPTTCVALVLQDGGTALPTSNISNATGTYAPEQTLSGFTGDPNGNWVLSICDDAALDIGSFRLGRLNFCTVPSIALAGADMSVCANSTSAALGANTPAFGTGAWSVVSGGTGTFSNAASPTSTFTHTGGAGPVVLRWTISSGVCTATSDNMIMTVVQPPTTATVGGAQTICASGISAGLGGNTPSVGTGAWSVVSGGTGNFSNASSPNATFTHTGGAGPVVVRWTITGSAPCPASTANVSININQPPTTSTVGSAQMICASGTSAALGGNTPSVGTGAWSIVSGGTGTFSNPASGSSTFTHTGGVGPVVVRWTISNSPCTASGANVSITITQPPTTSNAGSNISACVSSGTATMAANTPSVGTGAWSFISGPVTPGITTPASPTSNITGMTTAGAYVFRWTISNSPCTASTSDVTITSFALPSSASAGSNQTICISAGSATMAANTPGIGTGAWSQISGPVSASIASNAPNTTITGMTTAGTYGFRWTITNGSCATSTSNVSIIANAPPTTANAGPPQSICTSVGTAVMAANTASVGAGSWSQQSGPSAASIVSASSPTTTINGLTTAGNYVFRWTISNNPCTASTSDVTISVVGVPTTANAGSPQTICASSGSVTMNGNTPTVGTGTWSQISGPVTGTIVSANAPGTSITGLTTAGGYVFRWRITSSPCTASSSNVTITVAPAPTVADAGMDQDICVSPGIATMAANTALVGTGTWSQISGPATASIANTSDELTDISGFNLVGAYVFRWTIDGTGCPSSTDDITVNVFGSPSTSDAGADQPICSTIGDATLNGNSPAVGNGAWTQVSGPVTATIVDDTDPATQITGMTTVGIYTFRWSISNGPCSISMDEVEIVSGPCAYYSRGTGDVNDAVWSDTPAGVADFASFSSITNIVVQSGDVVTNTSDINVGDLTVEAGATLIINGATTVGAHGDVVIDGTLSAADNSGFALLGSSANTLTTTGSPSFYDLTVDNAAGVSLTGSAIVRNTLLLEDGAFDAGTAQLVLPSTATYTGRLGPVGATASYVGDLVMQRYIPAGATNWRIMGSPVSGQTVTQWKDDFTTAGFPGSHFPAFDNPTGSGILWPSIRWYDETNTGSAVLDGLTGAANSIQSLASGQGFAAWCGTGLTTTSAFTVDVTGNPNVANSPITLPMTYTNTGAAITDGWNMVSNPLPSPILFSSIDRGADVADYVTYYDPASGNNATYDTGLGIGTNGGTNTIQSSQGFWLKATGSDVTTTVDEAAKIAGNGGGFFGGDEVLVANIVHLNIHSAINQYSDETLVVFSQGSPETNDEDVPKFVFSHPLAPQVATMADDGSMIAINAYGPYTTNISIPVLVNVAVNGNYSITVTGLANVGLSCLRMEDLNTGVITPLMEGASYTFTALADDDETQPRLLLHASAPLTLDPLDATCAGRDDGSATVDLDGATADVLWSDADNVVVLEQNNVAEGAIMALVAGEYTVQVASNVGCGALHTNFTIDEPSAMEATAIAEPTSCPVSEDGSIDLTVLGGISPYTFVWNTNATSEDLTVLAGTYTVEISDANGCNMAPQEYVVSAGEGPEVGISVESSTVMVNDAITFYSAADASITHSWDFGDDSTSDAAQPEHTYSEPGTYTVTLTVDDGTCTTTTTMELIVESTTGLPTIVGATLNAWVSGDFFVVDHNFTNSDPVLIRILSTNGQLLQQHRFAAAPARLMLSNADLATGIYLLRISNGNNVRTFSVPVTH